ncbi:MAG: GNAT family N-acetyltransferase [bacterium]
MSPRFTHYGAGTPLVTTQRVLAPLARAEQTMRMSATPDAQRAKTLSEHEEGGRVARLDIDCDLAPALDDIKQVRAGLMAFNDSRVGPADVKQIALYVRDADRTIRGGIFGYMAWRWLSVDLLWVDEALRGQGYGAALLQQAESLARAAGCVGVRLDTYEFQARPFYEHHGYTVFGVLDGYPANTRTYHLSKRL